MGDPHNMTAFGAPLRAQPGDRALFPVQLRVGDFLATGRKKYKVLRLTPKMIVVQEVDDRGRQKNDREKKYGPKSLRETQMKRIEELKRQDVSFDTAIGYIDGRHGYPSSAVSNQEQYRTWLRDHLTSSPVAPFAELRDDEARHQEQLERHLNGILMDRGVGEDWSWAAPPPVQINQRVQEPGQLHLGDFVEYYSRVYRVVALDDETVRAVPVNDAGRPTGRVREFDRQFLSRYRLQRVAPLLRDDVTFEDAEKFANQNLEHPPATVTSRATYRDWLMDQFKNLIHSPYFGLGADEVEHQHALVKQVRRLLEQRGVGPGWDR